MFIIGVVIVLMETNNLWSCFVVMLSNSTSLNPTGVKTLDKGILLV